MSAEGCLGTETLVDVVEGRSDAALRARVEQHASRCDACRRVLSSLARGTEPDVTTDAPSATPVQIGRYVVTRVLGAGGMGIVYAAYDPELDRTVAVKVLRGAGDDDHPAVQERLRREAQAMAQLAHPNVAAVHDVGVHDGRIFIAMEYVDGETLATWASAPRSERAIVDAYLAAGRGLAAAHAVGIVHRDFKPENVLVGSDGRVRVVDFGLARTGVGGGGGGGGAATSVAIGEVSPYAATTPGAALTATGALAGTPYYMAPELYAGAPADARSDQFSFCVALFTSLTGERPFAGTTLEELALEVSTGQLREPKRKLSRRLAAVVRRGLAVEPGARFASMDALLAALAPSPRRWPWLVAGGGALAAAVLAIAVRPAAGASCAIGDRLDDAWGPRDRLAVARGLVETRQPYAAATWREVERVLDRYAADWQAMQVAACEAARDGAQPPEILELRATCLDERRRALDGVTSLLATPDERIARRAVQVVAALPPIETCGDLGALRSPIRPPHPAAKLRVDELRAQLARLRAEGAAGLHRESLPRARAVLAQARDLAYRPLEGEAYALVGALEREADDFTSARRSLEQSILAAEAGADDRGAIVRLIDLIGVVARGLDRPDEVAPLVARARALLERVGGPPELEGLLLHTVGSFALDRGDFAAGERDLRAALAALERAHGKDDLRLVDALQALAKLEMYREQPEAARALLDRALAIQRARLGAEHPAVARTIDILGGALVHLRQYDDAIEHYERARSIYERTSGPASLELAHVLSNLATALALRGDTKQALEPQQRAVAIAERTLGADHTLTLAYRAAFATSLIDVHREVEALAILDGVLAKQRESLGVHPEVASTLAIVAHAELYLKRYAPALAHAREAQQILSKVLGADYNPTVELLIIGAAHYGLGDPAAAADAFARAQQLAGDALDPGTQAWLDAQLGRALVDSRRDGKRGRALVLAAWPKVSMDTRLEAERAELAAWMKTRGIAAP